MKQWQNIIIIILLFFIQVTLWHDINNRPIVPNLIIVLLIVYLLAEQDLSALWVVAVGGLMSDLYSDRFFGLYTITFIIIYIALYFGLRAVIRKPNLSLAGLIIFLVSLIINGVVMVSLRLSVDMVLVYSAFYEAILGIIFYQIINKYISKNKIILKEK